jgi:transposase
MKPIDGRTLSHEVSEHIRLMAVRRVGAGERPSDVIRSYGLCRTSIYRWLRAAQLRGEEALASRRAPGPPPKLTLRQKQQVFRWINGKDPRQYGFDFGLWTRRIVQVLVRQRFGVRVSVTAVGRMLAELEITPQKPLRRAYERDPIAIAKWMEQDYPRLRARARRRGAKIFFLDEAGIRSDSVLGRTWAPRGRTPEVPTSGRRQAVNAISAVNARGEFWFRVYTERLNKELFLHFLKAFLRGRRTPVMLVVDAHPAHRARLIAHYVQSLKGRLELHFLPGYAPELNPDEFVWNHLKKQGVSKQPLHPGESLRVRVHRDLERIRRAPALVRSFFRAPSVAYAAY